MFLSFCHLSFYQLHDILQGIDNLKTMSHSYEIEIKSLLGSKENADLLIANLKKHNPNLKLLVHTKQLNHYFNIPEGANFLKIESIIPEEKKDSFKKIISEGKKISLRARDSEGKVFLVMKASTGSDTSSNGVTRIEFEAVVNLSLEELDQVLLDAGFTYQAKWSRERDEYECEDMHICLDKNAGYGYLAEFEKVSADESSLELIKSELLSFMKKMGVEELPQDRLERMFAYYNAHWNEYYGTDKVFTII